MLWCGIWAVVTFLVACDHLAKPSSSGRPYEVLVVVGDSLWQRPAGRALFDVLDTDIPGLPQPERSFRISQTDPQRFNQVLNIFRNIIKVDIAPNQYTQTKMKFTRDVYAQPQVVLTIQSPNEKDFATFVQKNAQSIIDFLVKMEMNRQINELEKKTFGGRVILGRFHLQLPILGTGGNQKLQERKGFLLGIFQHGLRGW